MAWITLIAERGRGGDPLTRYAQYGEFRRALTRRIERLNRKPGAPLVFDGADNRGFWSDSPSWALDIGFSFTQPCFP